MNFLKNIIKKVITWAKSPQAQADIQKGAELAVEALPYIAMVADYATTGNAPAAAAWEAVKLAVPELFDGSVKTPDQLKRSLLGAAVTMVAKDKNVPIRVAQIAATLAFPQYAADHPEYQVPKPA